ncbi:MAG: GPR endopeptidase [Ruminococcaceae bacterium]|nr:GPR endopeptidase [Oscillospiraceae bacterium]
MELRTDLAVEAREIAREDIKDVEYKSEEVQGMVIERLSVRTDRAAQLMGKDAGRYVTVNLPPLTDNIRDTDVRILTISREIRRLLPVNGMVLVVGLGNPHITPDALGPRCVTGVLATRHITGEIARSTGLDRLRQVAVLSTGVTGQTGIETGELILSVVKRIKPTAVIVIDALASRRLERLGCTLQISDTGIAPGAGVGNHRTKICKEVLGVPVIALGVPTVVDAVTLVSDLVGEEDQVQQRNLQDKVSPRGSTMVVTPKEIDLLIDRASKLLSLSINMALHSGVETKDLLSLL